MNSDKTNKEKYDETVKVIQASCPGAELPSFENVQTQFADAQGVPKPSGKIIGMCCDLKPVQSECSPEEPPALTQSAMDRIKCAQTYATNYLKRHPNTKPDRLKKIVAKKFNIKITE